MYKESITEIAKRYLAEHNKASFADIWKKVLPTVEKNLIKEGFKTSRLTDAIADKHAELYTILILDKTFILVEKDIWSLRKFFTYDEITYKTGEMHIKSDELKKVKVKVKKARG